MIPVSNYKVTLGANELIPDFTFLNDDIESINIEKSVGVIGDTLSIDTIEIVVRYNGTQAVPKINSMYGTPIRYYLQTCFQDSAPRRPSFNPFDLQDKFYVETIVRESKNKYTIKGISAVGLLENKIHYGGVYLYTHTYNTDQETGIVSSTFTGKRFYNIIDELFDGILSSQEYSCDSNVRNIPIIGRLPYDTARNNLHKLLMANNVVMTKDNNCNIVFNYLDTRASATVKTIDDDRIYNDGSSEYGTKPTCIEITEYMYVPWAIGKDYESLYDTASNGGYADNQLVKFNNPVIESSLTTDSDDLTIVSHSANHVVLTGKGVLYGIPYFVDSKVNKYYTGIIGKEYVVSVSNNGLISYINSYDVAERLKDYYINSTTYTINTVDSNLVVELSKNINNVGRKYTFTNCFGEEITGIVTKLSKTVSASTKTECEIITGLTYYGRQKILYDTEIVEYHHSGRSWTVPSGVEHIMVALIGGGSGGDSGYAGEKGGDASESTPGKGGEGGEGGNPGAGGNIYRFELDVTPGSTINFTLGAGGAGGVYTASEDDHENNTPGSAGEPSTMTYNGITYSTAIRGKPSDFGFYDIMHDDLYARPNPAYGIKGGDGGDGGNYVTLDAGYQVAQLDNDTKNTIIGKAGEDVIGYYDITYTGGSGGALTDDDIYYYDANPPRTAAYTYAPRNSASNIVVSFRYHGTGGGSGACVGQDGNPGQSNDVTGYENHYNNISEYRYSIYRYGNGGHGNQPSINYYNPYYPHAGDGGRGGCGGGGGGGGGAFGPDNITCSSNNYTVYTYYTVGVDGRRSKGYNGGGGENGKNGTGGAIIIYY